MADLGVESRERFVEKKDLRANRQGSGERDALALSAREGENAAVLEALEIDEREHAVDRRVDFGLGTAADHEAVAHVLRNRHVREERVLLEHEADAALFGGNVRDVLAADQNARAFVRLFETGDDAQKRRLAAARRPEEHRAAARFERERKGLEHEVRAVMLAHIDELDGDGFVRVVHF